VYPGDLIEDSDKDDDHPYTDYLMPIMQNPSRSRASSVISDGGEQNHLALKEASDPQPDPLRTTSSRLPRARSQRNALQMQIYGAMEESRSDDASLPGHRFLPKDRLCQVINPTTVFDELVKCLPDTKDQIQKYADTICDVTPSYEGGRWKQKSFRLVFVILVLVERSKHILSFLDENVSDLDLPLVPVKEYGIVLGMQRRTSTTDRIPHDLLGCFDEDGWSPSSMEQFDRYQWFMLAPFFSDGKCGQINHYPLHDQHILPFLSRGRAEDDDEEGQGGYARVMMVTLHHAHHELTQKTNRNCNFAVKQLFSNDRESFEREREILKKFSGANSHRHIVSLLATYSYRNKYHFIFDRAQNDLGRFWEQFKQPLELAHGDVVWIADQCLGITEGLSRIHRHRTFKKWTQSMPGNGTQNKTEGQPDVKVEVQAEDTPRKSKVTFVGGAVQPAYHSPSATEDCGPMVPDCASTSGNELLNRCEIKYGRHGDINPQNILWFRDETEESDLMPGVMRGTLKIADFGTAEMNSFWSKSGKRDVANTLTYRPPECDSVDKTIRQSFDIWCLGCVFLEFIAWSMGGASLVRSFAEKRMSRDPAYGNDRTDTYFELVFNHNGYDLQAKIKDSVFEVMCFTPIFDHFIID
jgi:serine/threonine protein kinase